MSGRRQSTRPRSEIPDCARRSKTARSSRGNASDPLLNPGESFRLGRGPAFVIPARDVDERGAGLEGFVRGLDLLLGNVIGTAGLFAFCGSDPVIATLMTAGCLRP